MKNFLLIGGSYGIGLEIAKITSAENNIFVASRTKPDDLPIEIAHITFDALTDSIDSVKLPDVIDGFVYCPGSINLRPFKAIKPEAFESDMAINFFAMVKIIQSLLPKLLASENCCIVLFSSIAATSGMPFHTSIAAAKGAVESFAKALAAEFAPKIRVNVIAPSLTQTPLSEKFLNTPEKQEKSALRHPLKSFGKAENIAQMAAFLMSDKASWITGQVLHVDGGLSTISLNQ